MSIYVCLETQNKNKARKVAHFFGSKLMMRVWFVSSSKDFQAFWSQWPLYSARVSSSFIFHKNIHIWLTKCILAAKRVKNDNHVRKCSKVKNIRIFSEAKFNTKKRCKIGQEGAQNKLQSVLNYFSGSPLRLLFEMSKAFFFPMIG